MRGETNTARFFAQGKHFVGHLSRRMGEIGQNAERETTLNDLSAEKCQTLIGVMGAADRAGLVPDKREKPHAGFVKPIEFLKIVSDEFSAFDG